MKKQHIGIALAAVLAIGGLAACSPDDKPSNSAAASTEELNHEGLPSVDEEKELFLDTVYDGAQMMWDGYTPEMQGQICTGYESIGATTAEGIGQAIEDQGIDVTAFVPVDEIPTGVTVDEALNAAFQVFVDGCGF